MSAKVTASKPTVASVAGQAKLTEPRTVVDTIFTADELQLRTVTVYPIRANDSRRDDR
jgi:hypothetical protein